MDTSNKLMGDTSSGQILLSIMKKRGISKNELCRLTGLSYVTINRLCSGDAIGYVATWKVICKALDISMEDIFG